MTDLSAAPPLATLAALALEAVAGGEGFLVGSREDLSIRASGLEQT